MKQTPQLKKQRRQIYFELIKAKVKQAYWNADKVIVVFVLTIIFFLIMAFIILF